jgi:hypothetical protein
MDELIARLAAKAGITTMLWLKNIGIILGFRNEGPSDKVQALIDKIPAQKLQSRLQQ